MSKIGKDVTSYKGKIVDKTLGVFTEKMRLKVWKQYQHSINRHAIQTKMDQLAHDKNIRVRHGRSMVIPNTGYKWHLIRMLAGIRDKKESNPNVFLTREELKIFDAVFQL